MSSSSSPNLPLTTRAIVAHGPFHKGQWKLETLQLRALRDDEVLVRIVAAGLCHTDLVLGDEDGPGRVWPRILGHEGSGFIETVGSAVKHLHPGDPVLLSFASCGACSYCTSSHPAYCTSWNQLNMGGGLNYHLSSLNSGSGSNAGETATEELNVHGSFFGQSSFAELAIVNQSSVVSVKGLVSSENSEAREELKALAPLGCGVQTGVGAVVNIARPKEGDAVCVLGAGGVGLSSVMAAKLLDVATIIVIDKIASRLTLARELGATHTINTSTLPSLDALTATILPLTPTSLGPTITIETTGYAPLIPKAIEFTAPMGKIIQLGVTPPTATLADVPVLQFLALGKAYLGGLIGDSVPEVMVRRMVGWWKEGKLPLERLVGYFEAEEFERAVRGSLDGSVVKPVLLW